MILRKSLGFSASFCNGLKARVCPACRALSEVNISCTSLSFVMPRLTKANLAYPDFATNKVE
jgi:hypothetical protein